MHVPKSAKEAALKVWVRQKRSINYIQAAETVGHADAQEIPRLVWRLKDLYRAQ
jgi:hypothetical protein